MEVFHRFITQKYADRAKKPEWVKRSPPFVQDDIDTNLSLDLAGLAERLKIDPGGLANTLTITLSGEIRRLRMEKAMQLMEEDILCCSEIALYDRLFRPGTFLPHLRQTLWQNPPRATLKTIRALKEKEEEE